MNNKARLYTNSACVLLFFVYFFQGETPEKNQLCDSQNISGIVGKKISFRAFASGATLNLCK